MNYHLTRFTNTIRFTTRLPIPPDELHLHLPIYEFTMRLQIPPDDHAPVMLSEYHLELPDKRTTTPLATRE